MIDYTKELSPVQQEAVLYNDGPALVIAGAGSGKTRVLTYKLAQLIESGYSPSSLMALTFTNKAAREMRERIAQMVSPEQASPIRLGTFHSVFSRFLRTYATRLGFDSRFSVLDSDESKSIIKKIIKERDLDTKIYTAKLVLNRISSCKNNNIAPEDYKKQSHLVEKDFLNGTRDMAELYSAYVDRCRVANSMDFDDLLYLFNKLLAQHPDVLASCQNMIDYLLIDEFQDTNPLQYEIVRKLVDTKRKIFAVGDDAQSIYAFRGANIQNILSFHKQYPNMRLFKLEENYRSSQNIVNLANSLIEQNSNRIPKNVFSRKEEGLKISLNELTSGMEEARFVVNSIAHHKQLHSEDKYSSYAILYRTNAQSRLFEEHFLQAGIPYRIYGGVSFYGRAEIKNVLAYLHLLHNPNHNEAFLRAAQYPKKGIGAKTLSTLTQFAQEKGISLFKALQYVEHSPLSEALPKAGKKSLSNFCQLLFEMQEDVEKDFFVWIQNILKKTEIIETLKKDNSEENANRIRNIEEFITSVQEYISSLYNSNEGVNPKDLSRNEMLTLFLEGIALATDKTEENDSKDSEEAVHLMTVHASKGLEYKYVYIVGLEEGLFPSLRDTRPEDIEEERRLLYVAITRAKKECSLNLARFRITNGMSSDMPPSRFLREIDHSLISFFGVTDMREYTPISSQPKIQHQKIYQEREERTVLTSPNRGISSPKDKPSKNKDNSLSAKDFIKKETILVHNAEELSIGDIVYHKLFGNGKVVTIDGEKDSAIISIDFDDSSNRSIILRYASLKKYL